MWLRDPIAIELSHSASTPLGFQAFDEQTGLPLSLVGVTLTCSIAVADGEDAFYEPEVVMFDASTGEYDITFEGDKINMVDPKYVSTYSYQILATDANGQSVVLQRGSIILVPGI